MKFAVGQRWTYRTAAEFQSSRLVIGAIVSFGDDQRVICSAAAGAPHRLADGTIDRITIPFLPLSEAAFMATVRDLDGIDSPPAEFHESLAQWREDARGLSIFTVPFDGFLDQFIARQMTAIVSSAAA